MNNTFLPKQNNKPNNLIIALALENVFTGLLLFAMISPQLYLAYTIPKREALNELRYPPLTTSIITKKENPSTDNFILTLDNQNELYVNKDIYNKARQGSILCWIAYKRHTSQFKNFGDCTLP